jgi:hypothetical protein
LNLRFCRRFPWILQNESGVTKEWFDKLTMSGEILSRPTTYSDLSCPASLFFLSRISSSICDCGGGGGMRPLLRNNTTHPSALAPFERFFDGLRTTSQVKALQAERQLQ